jgi:hypothetical protein
MGTKNFSNANDLITFSRASGGTALRKIAYGSELVTNGTFDTDVSGWAGGNATLSAVSASLRVTNDSSNYGYSYQAISTVIGKTYAVSVTRGSTTSGAVPSLRVGTSIAGFQNKIILVSSAGDYTAVFVATSTTTYISVLVGSNVAGQYTEFDNVSVKEVLFDQGDLTLFNHPADIPRIEYDADGNVLGLLVEESRTNLVTHSEDFTQPVWAKSAAGTGSIPVVTSNYAVAPDGTNSASRIQMNAGSGTTSGDYSLMRFTVSSAPTTLINSLWIKSNTESSQTVKLSYGASDAVHTATTEWQRFDIVSGNPNFADVVIRGDQTVSSVDLLIWGYQAEAGDFPTSYIPTNGATATRSADAASIPVSAFGYNQSEGTLFVEFDSNGSDGADYPQAVAIIGSASTDVARIGFNQTNTAQFVVSTQSGGNQAVLNNGTYTPKSPVKFAGGFEEDNFASSMNGSAAATDVSGSVPSNLETMGIGKWATGNYLNGHIKSIKYYPRRLSNAQLVELTS